MMKKQLFASASALAVLLAAPAMANESEVNQIGSSNSATTNQTGGSEGDILIEQGTGFYGTVSDAQAFVTQSEDAVAGALSPTNEAEIYQAGDSQLAVIIQVGSQSGSLSNYAVIDQDGTAAAGVVDGTSFSQTAALFQNGKGNTAYALQGDGSVTRGGQTAGIGQVGDDNYVDAYQDANDTSLGVAQTGDSNTALLDQSSAGTGGRRASALVIQAGNSNFSDSEQHGRDGVVNVSQTGDGNDSYILQTFRTTGSLAFVEQVGNGNYSDIEQTDTSIPSRDPNFAEVGQVGDDNNATIFQSGNNGNNVAAIGQFTNGNTAEIIQTGSRNMTIVFVSDALGASGDNNSLVTQSGNRNTANVTQDGDLSGSTITQSGNDNEATVLAQSGSGHISLIDQSGDDNDALITQGLTDNESSIFQTGTLGLVTVFQTATTGNNSTVNQGGVSNVALVNQ